MSSTAVNAISRDCSAGEWSEAILFWMARRYVGRSRATLRSWRATTYPIPQMMEKVRTPVMATATTRGMRAASSRVTAGARRNASISANAKRIEKIAGEEKDEDRDREHEQG